jgi:hypothetical protein
VNAGRVFKRVFPHIALCLLYKEVRDENGERWIEDVYIQPQSIWQPIEYDTFEACRRAISAREMSTILAIVFLAAASY